MRPSDRPGARAATLLLVATLPAALAACGAGPMGALRFANRPVVTRVDDRRPVPEPPQPTRSERGAYAVDHLFRAPVLHTLQFLPRVEAQNINALGEVPDSTWFHNRVGVRPVPAAELRRGDPPSGPFDVLDAKHGGGEPGFIIRDPRGRRYLLKFDEPEAPELQTGADAVVSRLLWLVGYDVPEDHVIEIRRADLQVVAPDPADDAHRPDAADIDQTLALVARQPDGGYRALVSRMLAGEPLGGYALMGTRPGDPNDRVPHQHRRDVRAQAIFFNWLGHTDIKLGNTLDMLVEEPPGSGRRFVRHHLVDFGLALGGKDHGLRESSDGFAPRFSYRWAAISTLTFGLYRRPWEGIEPVGLRGLWRFPIDRFRPDIYSPAIPYTPFDYTDRFDGFWAARVLARVTPEHIREAVAAGRYSDPRTVEYLERALWARRNMTLRYWFQQVDPLADFAVSADTGAGAQARWRICGRDLLLASGLAPGDEGSAPPPTRYELSTWDAAGDATGWEQTVEASEDGAFCAAGVPAADGAERYTIVSVVTRRGDQLLEPVWLHLAVDPATAEPRLIGVDRR